MTSAANPPHGDRKPELSVEHLDELLEVLYWMQGEGFAEEATLDRLSRFLTYPASDIARLLQRLIERGDVEVLAGEPIRYQLTAVGKREGGRRFQEAFAPLLAQGHGECNDPDCDCMTDPAGAAACRHHDHVGPGAS